MCQRAYLPLHVTIAGNDVAHGDDGVVLTSTGPGDKHVVAVSPLHRRDVVLATTAVTLAVCSFFSRLLNCLFMPNV